MRKIRTHRMPDNTVELEPRAFRKIYALSIQSRRSIPDLLSIAIDVFATATEHIEMMHVPPAIECKLHPDHDKWVKSQQAQASRQPETVGSILTKFVTKERKHRS